MKRIALGVAAAGLVLALAGCPSPLLQAVQDKIAQFPFTATAYKFVTQWGNPHPEYSFGSAVVKVDTSSYVYVADSTYRIRKFSPSGSLLSTYDVGAATGINGNVYDLAFDSSGNMYVATNSTTTPILKYNAGGSLVSWTPSGTNTISKAVGLAVDSSGNVYVLDSTQKKVLVFDSSGATVTSWSGTGNGGSGGVAFSTAQSIAIDSNGYVYVCDSGTGKIQEYSSSGYAYGQLSITLSTPTAIACDASYSPTFYVANTGAGTILKVSSPYSSGSTIATGLTTSSGIAVDGGGNVYVADFPTTTSFVESTGRIQKYNSSGTLVATWGGSSLNGNGQLLGPSGVAFDSSGNVYVCEVTNHRIQKFSASGAYLGQWSDPNFAPTFGSIAVSPSGNVYAVSNGTSKYVQVLDSSLNPVTTISGTALSGPFAVTFDSSGNIYITDTSNSNVVVLDPQGYTTHVPQTIGTAGTSDGNLFLPIGVAVDSKGNVYVANYGVSGYLPHLIQKFDKNGNFLTAWGAYGTGDGELEFPVGIAVDKYDHVYVCDVLTRRVQKFDSEGKFLAKWGGVGVGSGTFGWPFDIAVDAAGNVAVTDATNNLLQYFSPNP